MRIARIRQGSRIRLALVVDDRVLVPDVALLDAAALDTGVLASDPRALQVLEAAASSTRLGVTELALDSVELLEPVGRPGKIVAIGLNYRDHAAEMASPPPSEPLVFAKFTSSICGPGEPIRWDPQLTRSVDFEAELAVVIGQVARAVPERKALEHVLGYTCLNDVSARDLQFGDGQWVRGKSLDTFCPIGPWIVTKDEIPDPSALRVSCAVSGDVVQDAPTSDMIFGVGELISRLSAWFTLEPGDVIATGTPPGAGFFRQPKRFLRDGDVVEVRVEGIGTLRNPVGIR